MMTSDDSGALQASSLSTLIGYITGPKAEQPVGVRVVEPPSGTRQKQRGNMYAVVDLAGSHPDHDVIADHLLTVLQRTYYSAKGSQSHVMIEAVRRAHQVLREINLRYPDSALRAGVLCAALLNGRLVVVASGSAMALVRVSDQVQMFPSELRMEQGASPDGDVPMQIFRQNLGRDDVLFLGGSRWLHYLPIKTLGGIVAFTNADNCADAADELYAHGGEDCPPGLLIVLVEDPDAPQTGPAGPVTGPARQQSKGGASRFLGLPTALSAAPPARATAASRSAALVSEQPRAPATTEPQVDDTARHPGTGAITAADQVSDPVTVSAPSSGAAIADAQSMDDGAEVEDGGNAAEFDSDQQGPDWSTRMSTVAAASMVQAKRFLTRMLPDSSREEVAAEEAEEESDEPDMPDEAAEDAAAVGGFVLPPELEPLSMTEDEDSGIFKSPPPQLPEIEPYTAPAPATGKRARLFVLIALLILILVPAVVGAVYWSEGETRRKQAEQLTLAASAKVSSAETTLNLGDKVGAREELLDAKDYLSEAISLDGSNAERTDLAVVIEQMLQDVLQVQPLYGLTTPLLTFAADARPHRVLVADSSIYVLDSGSQSILRYRYDPAADQVTDETPQLVMQQGTAVDGVTVGTLTDMAWLPLIPGIEDKPTLLILDRNNNLFSYDPRVEGARLLEMNQQQLWRSASQVQTYNGRTYVADEGANEIFRYNPGQTTDPDEWFSDDTLVNLAGTIAMEIDGDIWLLLSSGNIMRYRSGELGGEQLPFSLETSVGLAEEPVDMYVTTEDRNQIYLADAGEDRILVYDKNGVFEKQLRAAEGDPLRGLSGIFIDEIGEKLFILTGSALYSHQLL